MSDHEYIDYRCPPYWCCCCCCCCNRSPYDHKNQKQPSLVITTFGFTVDPSVVKRPAKASELQKTPKVTGQLTSLRNIPRLLRSGPRGAVEGDKLTMLTILTL